MTKHWTKYRIAEGYQIVTIKSGDKITQQPVFFVAERIYK